jgi:hypothetical protein
MRAHYRLLLTTAPRSGTKRWFIRPLTEADEWRGAAPRITSASRRLEVECRPGDFLLINTRLWWHHTKLPPQDGAGAWSISFARDFHCAAADLPGSTREADAKANAAKSAAGPKSGSTGKGKSASKGKEDDEEDEEEDEDEEEFVNVDGLYAARNVRKGQVVLRESELPDCSLPRTYAPSSLHFCVN